MSVAEMPSPPTSVGPWSNGMLMTAEEFDAIEHWDENYRYELIQGMLIVTPPASFGERNPNDELGHLLRLYRDAQPKEGIFVRTAFEQEIQIGANRRRADRAVWIDVESNFHPLREVPTIAIEFVSQSRRDRHRDYFEKRREYGEAGVKEYWVIDRFARDMTVFRGMDETLVIKEDEIYTTPLLPGFELPLAKLLASNDRFTDSEE